MKLKTLAQISAIAALAGIGMPAFAQQTVTWWDFFAGGDGVRMKALIEQFNEEHPDVQIEGTTLEWGVPFYTKVRTSAAVGRGPDLMTYHLSRMPLGLSEGVLTPITAADLDAAGLSEGDFFASSLDAAKGPDGTLYAVPFDIHSIVLYYNKTYLEGTRFLDDEGKLTGIESLADFEEALQAAADNGSEAPVTYATGDDGGTYRVFYTLLSQQGGTLISEDGEVLPGDSAEKAVKALEIMTNWHDQGWQPEQALYEASVALFTSGKSAFQLNGVWEVPTMKDLEKNGNLGFEWGAVEIPKLMDTRTTWADSHAWAIPVQGDEEMDPAKREAVMQVIGWMEKHAIQWADAGHIPAYKPVAESDEFKTMEPNATYSSLADGATYDPRSEVAGVASPAYDAAQNIISPAMHGYLSAEDAIEQVKSELESKMN
ncbi:extracellular solute-binding protein [Alloyangia pacifica]|uniref:Carbohydrate ABC transporter substrate-binding protein, CUT1 family (TC 3.A.1.1.-) n=1 Tax=Alloyangia pacifica TaxID=311180 RepID=A0A1I6ULJ6_9RHOB|nr:extracellular solute-binding protein [Alloyangia pacifica]SDH74709.1 carbohydrate ABC transporter substrate-binding protein, CUT1 family (TC 3.A.1.1.-) [Alloyangia pacifica]SFT02322.1 carbohydrate ABC transporter substrate-binding protein, CUT1 family (TC 3.A.1.1.-) [Alloyangia pacifica]